MSKNRSRPKSPAVDVEIPDWIMGGTIVNIADFCGWEMRVAEGKDNVWSVRTKEAVHGEKPGLLTLSRLATGKNHLKTGVYSRLNRLRPLDHVMTDKISGAGKQLHESIMNLMGDYASGMLASIDILTSTARDVDELRELVREVMTDGLLPQLPGASVFLLEVSEVLPKRYQLVRALLPTSDNAVFRLQGGRSFRAARALFNDTTVGLGCYIDVLVTSLAPNPWGMAVGRPGGVVLFLFGQAVPGHRGVSADPIVLFGSGRGKWPISTKADGIPAASFEAAANWWVKQLDLLFSMATEPANYAPSGTYDPQMALEKLLSLEQFFRDCQSIAVGSVDQHASRRIMFSALETLGGLSTRLKWEVLTNPRSARQILDDVRAAIPPTVHDVLLPRAVDAVTALERLAEGFFVPEATDDGGLKLPNGRGREEIVSLDNAVSLWLRVIRNSQHGFDQQSKPRDRVLLSSHDGVFPEGLADLVWLYLLHLMTQPTLLRRHAPMEGEKRGA